MDKELLIGMDAEFVFLRWKAGAEIRSLRRISKWNGEPWSVFWKESAGFISCMPRLSGKSTMLRKMICSLSQNDYLVVVECNMAKDKFLNEKNPLISDKKVIPIYNSYDRTVLDTSFELECDYNNIDLYVDEYSCFCRKELNKILGHPWKSVTMISTTK